MEHNYVRDDNFCILTIKHDKKGMFNVSGNSKLGINVGDTINYLVNENGDTLRVDKVVERRDDKSFPKGNNLWYRVLCGVEKRVVVEAVK
jgi:hypothetical protein